MNKKLILLIGGAIVGYFLYTQSKNNDSTIPVIINNTSSTSKPSPIDNDLPIRPMLLDNGPIMKRSTRFSGVV